MENITPILRQCTAFMAKLVSKSNSSMPPLRFPQCQLQGHFCYSTGGDPGPTLTLRTLGGLQVQLIPTWALNSSPAVGQTFRAVCVSCCQPALSQLFGFKTQ